MEKKKKTRFIVGWLLITAALLAGSLLVPGHGKSESVQEAMRDAVLHGTNRISLFGLKDVNPAYISSLVVVGVILLAALLLRLLSPFYFLFCIKQIYSAALRGARNSQVPMWIMLGSFVVFRQIYLYIVAHYVSNEIIPIAMSYPAGWFVCSVATLIYYRFCKFDSHRLVEDV